MQIELLSLVAALLFHDPGATTCAFTHVNVVPMGRERLLADQVVVTRDGAIVALGDAATTPVPAGATVIDGHGAFLLPGLADLHTHAQQPDDLFLYVAHGVTTMLNLGLARPGFVTQTRARIAAGELIAPNCFVAPLMNGPRGSDLPCATVDEAKRSVRLAHELGYEFIKVYNDLSKPLFHALCDEAHAQGMTIVGHGVRAPGLAESFDAGQVMVAHGEEYLYTILRSQAGPGGVRDGVDVAKIPEAVALTKQHDVFVVPNLSAYAEIGRQWGKPDVVTAILERPEIKYLRPFWRRAWRDSDYAKRGGNLDGNLEILRKLTKALHDGGVRLLLGTDSPDIPGVQSGFSIHEDLDELVKSGLTPFQALECGTRIAGEFIGEFVPDAEPFGTVAIGQRADLVLVEKNPLADVANLNAPLGVMVRGRWLPREELTRRLDALAARFTQMAACERTLLEEGDKAGFVAACDHVRAADRAKTQLDEETLNEKAYRLMRENGKRDDALALLKLNTELHPESSNTFDSYGEVLALAGRLEESRASYQQALALDPKSPSAKRALGTKSSRVDEKALEKLIERATTSKSDSLVVFADGVKVCEEHFGKPQEPIELMSCTKSVVSLLVGILIDEKKIASLDTPVSTWFPEWRPEAGNGPKSAITVGHLLSHTSGIQANRTTEEIYASKDFVKLALEAAQADPPGTKFFYNNKAVNLLAGVIERASGMKMDDFAREKIFDPLDITDFHWTRDASGNPHGMSGLELHALDFAKIGQLLLQHGKWNGETLVSEEWIAASTKPAHPEVGGGAEGCGLLWWLEPESSDWYYDDALLAKWKGAGGSERLLAVGAELNGRHWKKLEELRAALRDAIGKVTGKDAATETAWFDAEVKKLNVPFWNQVAGPTLAFRADGWLGNYLVVCPKKKLIAVRQRRYTDVAKEQEDPRYGMSDFTQLVLALIPSGPDSKQE